MDFEIDAKSSALVLIDLQQAIARRQTAPHAAPDVVRRCASLADAVRKSGGTVVYVRVLIGEMLVRPVDAPSSGAGGAPPPNATEIVPEAEMQPGDLLVSKRQWGAFYGTDLDLQLRRRAIRTVILGGIATNFGVESTARFAAEYGYELVFAEDAMSSLSAEAHDFAVSTIFPRLGRIRSTEQITGALR